MSKSYTNLAVVLVFGVITLLFALIAPVMPERSQMASVLGYVICLFFPLLSLLCTGVLGSVVWTALQDRQTDEQQFLLERYAEKIKNKQQYATSDDLLHGINFDERRHLETLMLRDSLYDADAPTTFEELLKHNNLDT